MLVAELTGETRHHARWRPLAEDEEAAAVAELRAQPGTDYSVVMNARTGQVSDSGECICWPLPLGWAGLVISLPARC